MRSIISAEEIPILTYNVLYRFNHGKATKIGAKWIAEQKPDIVALQELNNFKQGTFGNIAKRCVERGAGFRKGKSRVSPGGCQFIAIALSASAFVQKYPIVSN